MENWTNNNHNKTLGAIEAGFSWLWSKVGPRVQRRRPWGIFPSLGGLLCAACLSASPAKAAERIYASYAVLERSIPVSTLEMYAKEGKIEEDLAVYAQYVTSETLEDLREILLAQAELSPVVISQFLYTRQGEVLLKRLGQVIQSGSRESGFYGLRAALILAAADEEGLTLLNVLRKFPTPAIRLDLSRAVEMAEELQGLVNESFRAIDGVMQLAMEEANLETESAPALELELEKAGIYNWKKISLQLRDTQRRTLEQPRGRPLDVDVYVSEVSQKQPSPTIVISHGLGSDRGTFEYLAKHLASHGFAVIVPQHPGSDAQQLEALLTGVAREVAKPIEFVDRPLDITFVLDELERLSLREPKLAGKLDLQNVGVVGQSFGGYTALALAGAPINFEQLEADCAKEEESWNVSLFLQCRAKDLPKSKDLSPSEYRLRDDRIKAAIAINPISSSVLGPKSLSQIEIPVMIVAGGADTVAPALVEQIQPFTWLTAQEKYLVLMRTGTHFSALGKSGDDGGAVIPFPPEVIGPNPALAQRYMSLLGLVFFETHISDRADTRPYLSSSYVSSLSQDPIPVGLLRALSSTQLARILE